MNKRSARLIASSILVFLVMAACSLTPLLSKVTPGASSSSSSSSSASSLATSAAGTVEAAIGPTSTEMSAGNPTAISPNGACGNVYYPHPSGASWSYASSGGELGNYTYTASITADSGSGFTTRYAASTGVDVTFDWKCQDGDLAALDAGAGSFTMITSNIKMTSDSVTADGYNIPASFTAGKTWAENVTVKGTVANGAGKTVKSQIESHLECSAAGSEPVSVPAGSFDAVKASCTRQVVVSAIEQGKTVQLAANTETITYWYVKGVGYVKSVATGGSNNETVVLTGYKLK